MIRVLLFCLAGVLAGSDTVSAQEIGGFSGSKSTWKGFIRYDFQFQGRNCRVVCPDHPAQDNPWIWNARFPDWHTDIDSILLSEGVFVTYINTDELIGSPKAVEVWNEYYNYLISTHKFCTKVALEGISRGGLYVYNFAKKYPGRVSCIYAEAKVPILHMIGLHDVVVPPELNTFVLVNRYIRLGGIATVIPSTGGVQELEGHHFPIETPRLVADFVEYYEK